MIICAYDGRGRILGAYSCSRRMAKEYAKGFWCVEVDQPRSPDDYFVEHGAVRERPQVAEALRTDRQISRGATLFAGELIGASIEIDGDRLGPLDGRGITFTTDGVFNVTVTPPFPLRPFKIEVTVTV